MRAILAIVVLFAPLLRAQNAISITPVAPEVVLNQSKSSTSGTGTFNALPGSVMFTIGGASGSVFVSGPSTITGKDLGLVFQPSSPAVFTLGQNLTGFDTVQGTLSDEGGGLCTIFNGKKTDTCNVTSIQEISDVYGVGFVPGISLQLDIELDVGNIRAVYTVYFQWTVSSGVGAQMVDIDVVQETTYNDTSSTDVTLIADKPTLVRAYASSLTPISGVTAVLHGAPGPSSTEYPDSPLKPMNSPLPARTDVTLANMPDDRDNITKTFNFVLPPEWIHAGSLTLHAELQLPANVDFDPTKTIYTETVKFVTGSQSLWIAYIPYCYQTATNCVSDRVANYADVIKKLYPINPKNVHYVRLYKPDYPWTPKIEKFGPTLSDSGFKANLNKTFHWVKTGKVSFNGEPAIGGIDQLAGWLPPIPEVGIIVGESDPPFFPFWGEGNVFVGFEVGTDRYIGETLAHEVGHNLNVHHTNFPALCNDSDFLTDWPYDTPLSQLPGFDFVNMELLSGHLGDLMSYCDPNGISPWDVKKLLQSGILTTFPGLSEQAPKKPAPAAAATGEQILISGWAKRDGSGGSLDPVYRMPADGTASSSRDGGSHCLHFSGASGALGDYCFQLSFKTVEGGDGVLDQEYFARMVPLPAGATRIALMAGTKELASLTASSAPPSVTITSPQTGDVWNGGMGTISWSATDPDNRPLVFTVLYSYDGGQFWIPMALDITDTQLTFDSAKIMGGGKVLFRVVATDGMNSTSVDVGPLQVNQAPTISVPATLDFGTAAPGAASIQTLTITNPGTGPLMVNSYTIDNAAFTAPASSDPLAVGAGETGRLSIRWLPTTAGAQSGTLTLASNDPANPTVTVRLSGTAADDGSCRFSLSSSVGSMGSPGGSETLTVNASAGTCTWTAASNVPWITIGAVATGTGTDKVTFTVAANSTSSRRSGTLTVAGLTYTQNQAAGATTGTGPSISVSGKSLGFGSVAVGQTPPAELTLNISSAGTAPLTVTSLTIQNSAFTLVSPPQLPYTIGDASLQLRVRFTPTGGGPQTGTLTIASNDPDPTHNPWNVSLSGVGVAGPPTNGACLPPAANLVSWWTGDGNATDLSGKDNGTVLGATTFAAGEVGQAFQFDGSTGYVNVGNPANLQLTSALTIEAWINPHAAPPSNTMAAILTKWAQIFSAQPDSDSYGFWIRQDPTAGLTLFGAVHQAGSNEPHVQGGTIPLNAWTHVAMTFESGTGAFVAYVNGQAVNSLTSPGAIVTTTRNAFIGREDSILPRPFNGLIDELTVYSRALSAGEIQAIYNAGSAGKCKGTPGEAGAPSISVSPKSLNFGTVTLGQPPATMKFTISNTGQADLHVKAITLTGDPSFSLVPAFAPLTIAAGKSTDITVQFAPTATGSPSGSASIASDDPNPANNPLTVSLSATVNAGPPTGGGHTGNITSLKVESGTYNTTSATFSNSGGATWDTDPNSQNWVIGVSLPGTNNPLLNGQGKSINIPAGSYYTYYNPFSWGNDIRVTLGWSDGTSDIAYFHQAGFTDGTVWPRVTGATDVSVTYKLATPAICKVVGANPAPGPCSLANEILALTITGGSGNPPGGGCTYVVNPLSIGPLNANGDRATVTVQATPAVCAWSAAINPANPWITFTGASSGTGNGTVGIAVQANTTALPLTGTLSVAGQTVTLTQSAGSGNPPPGGVTTITLTIDGNTFSSSIGLPAGALDNFFVNRLTPPSYPATLRQVQIVFSNAPNSLPAGSSIKIVAAANPSGNSNITGISLARTTGQVTPGQVNTYSITPITITSGDFVVGFETGYPPGTFPAVVDITSPLRLRSYFSTDGTTFTVLDANSGVPGNLGIRGVADVGGTAPPGGGTLDVQPRSLDFGTAGIGQGGKDLQLTVKNNGATSLSLTAKSGDPQFTVGPSTSFSVPGTSFQTLLIHFAPVAVGPQNTTLTVATSDGTQSIPVTLTGIGNPSAGAGLDTSPRSLDFSSVNTGSGKDLTLTVKNTGSTSFNAVVTGATGAFTVNPSTAFAVGANSSQNVTVHFAPTAAGAQSATLTVATTDGAQSIPVPVAGTGVAPGPPQSGVLSVSPASLDYSNVNGGEMKELGFTLTNNGSNAVTVSAVTSSNVHFYRRLPEGSPPYGVSPNGGTVFISFQFAPELPGPQTGTLTIAFSDASIPPLTVSVSGNGVGSWVSPDHLTFGTVKANQQTQDMTISLKGNLSKPVNGTVTTSNPAFTLPFGTSWSMFSGTNILVRFAPTTTGPQSGTITITASDLALGTVTVLLTGTGN